MPTIPSLLGRALLPTALRTAAGRRARRADPPTGPGARRRRRGRPGPLRVGLRYVAAAAAALCRRGLRLGPRVRALVSPTSATSPTAIARRSGSPRRSGGSGPSIPASRSSWSPSRAGPASPSRPSSGSTRTASSGPSCWRRRSRRATTCRAALRAVRREIVVFWSPLDVVILGAGTRVFGTIDRVRTFGAGLVGFVVPGPDEAGRGASAAVRQAPPGAMAAPDGRTRPSRRPLRHGSSPWFLRKYVVPLLRADESAESGAESAARGQADTRCRRYPNGPEIEADRPGCHLAVEPASRHGCRRLGRCHRGRPVRDRWTRLKPRELAPRAAPRGGPAFSTREKITPQPRCTGGAGPPRMDLLRPGPGLARAS